MPGELKIPKIERLLPKPPPDWPWALPHLHSIDTVPDPGIDVVGYFAHKDGTGSAKTECVAGRTRVVEIGYWNGNYAVLGNDAFLKNEDAERAADRLFDSKPVRYRLKDGKILRVNEEVEITGNWPAAWTFRRYYDFGALCACLYGEIINSGHRDEAEALKASLHHAMPGTELIRMFYQALTLAKSTCAQSISPQAQMALDIALARLSEASGL
jgi:hypothetical protein